MQIKRPEKPVVPLLHESNMVARADNNSGSYEGGGYLICVQGERAAIGHVGHCSCYGTWDSGLPDRGTTEVWSGTIEELYHLSQERLDPSMPERKANCSDYDYSDLIEVYEDFITMYEKGEFRQ